MPPSGKHVLITADVAKMIKDARMNRGLTQVDVSEASGVPLSGVSAITLGHYNNGRQTNTKPSTLARVARAVRLNPMTVLKAAGVERDIILEAMAELDLATPATPNRTQPRHRRPACSKELLISLADELRAAPGTSKPWPYSVTDRTKLKTRINKDAVKALGPGFVADIRDDEQVWVTYDPQPEPIRETA